MYPDLAARLRQDVRKINRDEFYVIRDYSLSDGSFLLYHFIGLYLRSPENGNVYILGLSHPLNHYKVVLAKLGVQLQRQIDQNRCRLLDFAYYFSLTDDEKTKLDASWFRFGENNRRLFRQSTSMEAEEAMKRLYLHVKNEMEQLMSTNWNENSKSPLLIVIDCISVLLDFEIPLKYIIHFMQYLRNLGKRYDASFVILAKTDDDFRPAVCDDEFFSNYDRLASFLGSWGSSSFEATFIFDVKPLSTGWSRDVHGEVTIYEKMGYKRDEKKNKREGEIRLLYRLGDRNVSFMPPGLVPRIGV